MKDAICQTSDCETKADRNPIQYDQQKSNKRIYDHRRATDSLVHPIGHSPDAANPLMVIKLQALN